VRLPPATPRSKCTFLDKACLSTASIAQWAGVRTRASCSCWSRMDLATSAPPSSRTAKMSRSGMYSPVVNVAGTVAQYAAHRDLGPRTLASYTMNNISVVASSSPSISRRAAPAVGDASAASSVTSSMNGISNSAVAAPGVTPGPDSATASGAEATMPRPVRRSPSTTRTLSTPRAPAFFKDSRSGVTAVTVRGGTRDEHKMGPGVC